MAGVNKVILIGNVGKIDIHESGGRPPVVNLSLATSSKRKSGETGEQIEITEWHNVVAFGKLAEIIKAYVIKGSKVYIEGSLKTEKYEKDGITRYTTKIIANNMQMLSGKSDAAPSEHKQDNSIPYDFGDSLPF